MSFLNRMLAFAYKNYSIEKKNMFTLAEVFIIPIITVVSLALLSEFLNLKQEKSFILIGAISFIAFQISQLDVSYSLLFEVWSKSLKHMFVAPVRGVEIAIGSWLVGCIRALLSLLTMFSVLYLFFDVEIKMHGLLLFILGLLLSGLSLGILTLIFLLTFGYRVEFITWTIASVVMLFSGIYYPITILPDFLLYVAKAIPLSYILDYYRSFYGFESVLNIKHGFALLAIYLAVEFVLLEASIKRAKKTGIIIKMSE